MGADAVISSPLVPISSYLFSNIGFLFLGVALIPVLSPSLLPSRPLFLFSTQLNRIVSLSNDNFSLLNSSTTSLL